MGLSSMPSPSDSVLTFVLMNTALSVSVLKELLRSVLRLRSPQPPTEVEGSGDPPERSLAERFPSRSESVRFGSASERGSGASSSSPDQLPADCQVCLARFEPETVVNRLDCGHVFHKDCL